MGLAIFYGKGIIYSKTLMRLGETKQILDRVISQNSTIELKKEAQYGGQAQRIDNYADIISALEVVSGQKWSGFEESTLDMFQETHPKVKSTVLPQDEFNKLQSMINAANQKLPIFYSILETMVEPQNEQTINIKLPSEIRSLDDLSKENKKIQDVLKLYNVDGQFDFQQFDRGTDWYVVVAAGVLSYKFLIAGLDIAQKYFETRKAYSESKTAELDYRAAVEKDDVTKQEIKEFTDRKLKLLIEDEVKRAIEKIGIGTNDKNELCVKLVKATTALIKELDEGTEFHLSLNPPTYADEIEGRITIDYTQIKPLIAKTTEETTKKLDGPKGDLPIG